MTDSTYILRCLQLAKLGAGYVAPNPLVGCVIVHNNRIIGEGYHRKYGKAHAEVNAINAVTDASLLPDSVLYVNLEPCAHYGKTPPCANLIIKSGIRKVFIACKDPFAKVNGQGIKKLKNAGIDVNLGICEQEALELNRRFFTFHQKKRPYIILKWAETADGFVDTNRTDSTRPALKITGDTANILTHKWRAEEAAIMVGKNTAILDNPSLTTRKHKGTDPIRILLDSMLETPTVNKLFNESCRTLVFTKSSEPKKNGVEYIRTKDIRELKIVLSELYTRNIQSIIIEGGPTLHRSFYNADLWDEIRRFSSPTKIEDGVAALQLNINPEQELNIGADGLYIYRNR
ncbi:MAG: bifunctional diaminohydroxyphosphoribosylaminopyrimidine deaminase/5-amino-6-(5-phosphoribosylamino)uracil reductase RibD [Flavobacteriales bacterium]|nr:bifunctional diaminohydroxyphosphoribosylaminopyrimidine deaminase/5-amino-6-(5-phosphoribosylamino)uracil reductase RibD [Flavobacteriales bacterium]